MLPVKAVVMNALTVGTALTPLVLIYQGGHLTGLLGYTPNGGVEPSDFLVTAAIVFALSTDYGVFLLGRIKEARDGGLPDDEAVATGLARTGRVVTAAAILMAVAIGAFSHQLDLVHPADRRRHRDRRAGRRVRRAHAARAVADDAARAAGTGGRRRRCAACTAGSGSGRRPRLAVR